MACKERRARREYRPDNEKIKELILLISELSEGDDHFGATKLNKLLFFADFRSYQLYGNPITGYPYQARPEGPMISNFYTLRDEMRQANELAIRSTEIGGYIQHRTLALRSADPSRFSGEEMNVIHNVIDEYRHMTASEISAFSHGFLGWQAVDFGEEIPFETALVSTEELTMEEWAFPSGITVNFAELGIRQEQLVS